MKMDLELADLSAFYTELMGIFARFEVHAIAEVDAVVCICKWCGTDIFGEFDALGLDELARKAFTHRCADGQSAGELTMMSEMFNRMKR